MNIKILDSWLRDFIETPARPQEIAEKLSLTSLSVERVEKSKDDYLYEFEITTNRPDLYSIIGIAREASAILPQFGTKTTFKPLKLHRVESENAFPLEIVNNPKLVNRICAAVLEVKVQDSPKEIKERLETSDIRSLNNIIDVTNYVMRVTGHPTHVFDLDRLNTKKLLIREATKGEKIITLDKKTHILHGGEIVAVNDKNEIVDLLGIMGLENSVVTNSTKRILFFIDNNKPSLIRKASMEHAIRSEAATLNEKGVDPETAMDALLYGIELFKNIANGKIISKILDIYPNKPKKKIIEVSFEKINKIMGVDVDFKKSQEALEKLGFETTLTQNSLIVKIPTFRLNDIDIEEDIIEEVARVYGYHNLPSLLPYSGEIIPQPFINDFYWERRAKNSLKYWGFVETYTYSMVSQDLFEGEENIGVKIQNPLTEDFVYMRKTIVPSLLKVISENKSKNDIMIFEIANTYNKRTNDLPEEILTLAGVVKKQNASFYEAKGVVQQLLNDLGIADIIFKNSQKTGLGASVYIKKEYVGEIEILDVDLIDFELNFDIILKNSTLRKTYKSLAKFPPIVEDLSFIVPEDSNTQELINEIKKQSELITDVSLIDEFKNSKTFHIIYQNPTRNLTTKEVAEIRKKIIVFLEERFKAEFKA